MNFQIAGGQHTGVDSLAPSESSGHEPTHSALLDRFSLRHGVAKALFDLAPHFHKRWTEHIGYSVLPASMGWSYEGQDERMELRRYQMLRDRLNLYSKQAP